MIPSNKLNSVALVRERTIPSLEEIMVGSREWGRCNKYSDFEETAQR